MYPILKMQYGRDIRIPIERNLAEKQMSHYFHWTMSWNPFQNNIKGTRF